MSRSGDKDSLRRKAEEILQNKKHAFKNSIEDQATLLEELSIHQIELEMQNDELLKSQEKLEKEKKKFQQLYDYAPVAYITLNATGNIIDLNFAAARLFGKPREVFNLNSIFPFLDDDSKTTFRKILQDAIQQKVNSSGQIDFIKPDGLKVHSKVNAHAFSDNEEYMVRLTITDIVDERQKHLEELEEQELKYSEVFNNSNDAILVFQFNNDGKPGNFIQANSKACQRFDMSNAEFLAIAPSDIHINKNFVYLNRAAKELQTKQKTQFEMYHQRTDNSNYPVEVDAHIFEVHGIKMGLVMVRDISERVRAQQEIEETNNRLKMAMEVGHLGWWDWDYENNKMITADKKPALLGYNPDEVNFNAQDYIDMIHPDDYEMAMESMRGHLRGKADVYEVEYRLRKKDGSYIWLYDKGRVLERKSDGTPKRLMGVVYDISDRKRKEERIIESEKKLQALLTNLDDIIFEQDIEGNYLNVWTKDEIKLFVSKDQLIGKNVDEVLPQGLASSIKNAIKKAAYENKSVSLNYETTTHEEKEYYNAKITPVNDVNNQEQRFVSLVRNVTQRRKAEMVIKEQNEELQELNATKDKFFSIIAHDLKNPFNTILGFASQLLKKHADLDNDERERLIRLIFDSTKQNYSLLENLLMWSRMQSNRIPFRPEQVTIHELVKDNASLFSATASKKEIKIHLDLNKKENCRVKADREMINTVIRNLFSNAIKYTPSGGEIFVGCKKAGNEATEVFIKDTGIGIDEKIIPDLFRIDKTFSTPGTSQEQGTGLGLILVKDFVEKNNGKIHIESEKGKGTTFTITLKSVKDEAKCKKDCFGSFEKVNEKVSKLTRDDQYELLNTIYNHHRECYKSYSSRKVNVFSDRLYAFAEKHNLKEFKRFAERIKESMNKFDINQLNICFDEFDEIMLQLKQKQAH